MEALPSTFRQREASYILDTYRACRCKRSPQCRHSVRGAVSKAFGLRAMTYPLIGVAFRVVVLSDQIPISTRRRSHEYRTA